MNDDFDRAVSEELDGITPPEAEVNEITPWRRSMNRVVTGLSLTFFTLNFLYLQYILPALGVALVYLGFRTLRRSNRWFGACFALSAASAAYSVFNMLYMTTPLCGGALETPMTVIAAALKLALLVCFRFALRSAHASVGQRMKGDPAARAVVLVCVMLALAFSPLAHSWIAIAGVVLVYIGIVMALTGSTAELETWGYAAKAAPVRVSDGRVKLCYLLLLIAVAAAGTVYSARLPLDWSPAEPPAGTETRELLLSLGYPEELLRDVADDDLNALQNAVACEVSGGEDVHIFSGGRLVMTNAAVRTADGEVRVFSHFTWAKNPALRINDCIIFRHSEAFEAYGLAARLLYDGRGGSYSACADVDYGVREAQGFFGATQDWTASARVGWPLGAKNARGYFTCALRPREDRNALWFSLNYYNSARLLNLPYLDPVARALSGGIWPANNYSSMEGPFFAP